MENLIVYGANCVWWDSIDKCATRKIPGSNGPGLPCCPHCGSVLFQIEETTWFKNMDDYENGRQRDGDKHPGYVAMMKWARGKCFPTMSDLRAAHAAAARSA